MIDKIVHASEPIALFGGADVSESLRDALLAQAKQVVAADGGARHVMDAGRMPDMVIGDMDSLAPQTQEALGAHRLHRVAEQDSTDFEKCLMRIEAPLVLAAGFRGGRLDHDLAAMHALVRFAAQRCILLSQTEFVFLCPPSMMLDLPKGTPLSLFPFGPVTGNSRGLEWSFESLDYAPGGRIGTSNRVAGPVLIEMNAPVMLCILPRSVLDAVVTQLARQPDATWPSRA